MLFYRARRWNRLITWFSGSKFYHVGLCAGESSVIEARVCGVVCSDWQKRKGGRCFVSIPAPEDEGQAALDWAHRQVGDGYAMWSVGAIVLDRLLQCLEINITQRGQNSCGEFVVRAFRQSGIGLFPDLEPENVAPWHFARLLD